MIDRMMRGMDRLLEHYVLVLMVLSLAALTLGGVGDPTAVSTVGLLLCVTGLLQKEAKADLWILGALAVYLLLGASSSWRVYGDATEGYTAVQTAYLALYLLMAGLSEGELRLFRRLSILWAGYVAARGLAEFLCQAMAGRAGRLGGAMGNPNALGIFLVVAWSGLTAHMPGEEEEGLLPAVLRRLEPLLLTTLALTLSMGSFVALGAGMLFLAAGWLRREGWREALGRACRMLAKAGLAIGLGVLMYFTARRTAIPWFCLVELGYLAALTALWGELDRFLRDLPWAAMAMTAGGALVAAATVLIRPSSAATFVERLEMMRNGLRYIAACPLLGVGQYQWRLLNLMDADTYFNTWHIHNVLIHIGAELGLIAAGAMVLVIVRCYQKRGPDRAGFTAFLVHNLMDTSFFYMGVTGLTLAMAGEPGQGGRRLSGAAVKTLFAVLGAWSAYVIYAKTML